MTIEVGGFDDLVEVVIQVAPLSADRIDGGDHIETSVGRVDIGIYNRLGCARRNRCHRPGRT